MTQAFWQAHSDLAYQEPRIVHGTEWSVPDLSFAEESRRVAPPFPLEVCGPAANWVRATAEGTASPIDYVAASLLSAASALIGNARAVSPWDGWVEPPILWAALVGPPSHSKSPAMDPILRALGIIETGLAETYPDALRDYETRRETASVVRKAWEGDVEEAVKKGLMPPVLPEKAVEPDKPVVRRLVIQDATVERLCALMAANPKGLLCCRDELAGWIGSFDRYSGAGADRAFWTEAYGARPYTVDRKKNDNPVRIPRLAISVLGGLQPDRLNTLLLRGDDDGLTARMMLVWPLPVTPYRPTQSGDPNQLLAAFQRLFSLDMASDEHGQPAPAILPLSGEAATLFEEWRREHTGKAPTTGKIASHYGKLPGLALRLAVNLELLYFAFDASRPEPRQVGQLALTGALHMVEDYLKPMAERVYGEAAMPEAERLARTLARWIRRTEPTVVNTRVLLRDVHLRDLNSAEKIRTAIDRLTEADWLRPAVNPTGGRPRGDYEVNPQILEAQP